MTKRKPDKRFLALVALIHLFVTALTWRDLRRRPKERVRGGKSFWRAFSLLNTSGSVAYFLLGRRPPDRDPAEAGG